LLQGTADPSKLGGTGATLLAGGVPVSLNPTQRPGVGDFAGGDVRALLGNSFLQDLIARFGKSPSQLTDLAGSDSNASAGHELIDILGADLATIRSIYEHAKGDRTSQASALANKYLTNPPRALDQGTGLISQPPDGETIINKPDKDQLGGADAIRSSHLAPYINPGSGDDGGGAVVFAGGTELPRLVATVKDPPKPDSGTSTNVPDRGPTNGGVPSGGTPSNPDSGD
jgi:hypothetical protein